MVECYLDCFLRCGIILQVKPHILCESYRLQLTCVYLFKNTLPNTLEQNISVLNLCIICDNVGKLSVDCDNQTKRNMISVLLNKLKRNPNSFT